MLVLNVRQTTEATCSCGSWLAHWAKFGGGITTAICSANGCCKLAQVGSHVSVDGKTVVIPMCERHFHQDYPVDVYEHTVGVSADLAKTCAKPTLVELGLGALAGIPPHRYQAPLGVAGSLSNKQVLQAQPADAVAELLSGPERRTKRQQW